jgi:hypothetical protein
MSPAERILLRLDAHDCWAPSARTPAVGPPLGVEPVVVRPGEPHDDFGTNIAGLKSISDLQDLMAMWDASMTQLEQAYANAAPAWVARDARGFTDWTNDWTLLKARYSAAVDKAQSAVLMARLVFFTPNSEITAQDEYTALAKAMRQCYPPDGCPVRKGDWQDLYTRLAAAAKATGGPAPVVIKPQPKAKDVDLQVFASTANVDALAQLRGDQAKTTGPLPPDLITWLTTHKTGLLIGGIAIVGGILLISLIPTAMAAKSMLMAKGAAAAL